LPLPLPLPLSLPFPPPRFTSSPSRLFLSLSLPLEAAPSRPLSPLDPRMNLGVEDLARLGCERILIFVAEEDYLIVAAKNYYEKLKRSGWKGTVELVENEKEDHYFHLLLGIL